MNDGLDSTLHASDCFPQYKNMIDCVDSQIFYRKVCRPYYTDYLECQLKEKQSIRAALFRFESRQSNLLYVPRYNVETDTFETYISIPRAEETLGIEEHKEKK